MQDSSPQHPIPVLQTQYSQWAYPQKRLTRVAVIEGVRVCLVVLLRLALDQLRDAAERNSHVTTAALSSQLKINWKYL